MSRPSYSVRLPWPPSVNTCWRKGGNVTYLSQRGRVFREEAIADIREQLGEFETITGRVMVSLELTPPNEVKRDLDNHAKAPIDALMHAGLIADDEQIDSLRLLRLPVCTPGCVDVVVREIDSNWGETNG